MAQSSKWDKGSFVRAYLHAWAESETQEAFAARIGLDQDTVAGRVQKLRSMGMMMPCLAGEQVSKPKSSGSVKERAAAVLAKWKAGRPSFTDAVTVLPVSSLNETN